MGRYESANVHRIEWVFVFVESIAVRLDLLDIDETESFIKYKFDALLIDCI